jgi:hypothetical protein
MTHAHSPSLERGEKAMTRKLLPFMVALLFLGLTAPCDAVIGSLRVLDAQTHRPIEGALVTVGGSVASTDAKGQLALRTPVMALGVRAHGYRRGELSDTDDAVSTREVHLQPFRPRALYLSFYGIGDRGLRAAALKLLDETELNALVVDVKGDQGYIPYRSAVPLAAAAGAQKVVTVRDMPALLTSLRERDIYTIARIVAFKDDPLAHARPQLAVHDQMGEIWTDREGLAWTDPFRREVWDYILAVAEEAARLGFDEIQFDYLRFPDEPGLVFSKPSTEANRVAAISGFLTEAAKRLAPYNVFVAADVFGYVLWNTDDTAIGQRLEDLTPHLDYISPMLYPSGFQCGIPGYPNPVAAPYEMVHLSLGNAQKRTGLPALRFRPWLQAFRDYAFDRRIFGAEEIGAQIRGAEEFGSNGWMLWNPRNSYSAAGLRAKTK